MLPPGQHICEVRAMSKKNKKRPQPRRDQSEILDMNMRLDREQRLCPTFDSTSVLLRGVKSRSDMGVSVIDNCPEDHIM